MKQNIPILLYEKDKILNSILKYQISNSNNYDVLVIENEKDLYKNLTNKNFNTCILNLNNLSNDSKNLIKTLKTNNEQINIIVYHDPLLKKMISEVGNLFLLEKPFKLTALLNYLDSINNKENMNNSNKYLMNHIIFSPSKKTISNLETNLIEHLTEKENDLLIYFYNKKNEVILKKDLLTKIWGFSEKINTHTLETHIYRLKQKLNKIDKNLSLSLSNKNGLYYLK